MAGKFGKKWATPLAGFIAGAVVAAIVLVPWMLIQGKFCDVKKQAPTAVTTPEVPAEGEAPAPAPAPAVTP